MRTMMRTAVLLVLVTGLTAQPAHASLMAFYEYLEALSGPGPFKGIGLDLPLFCDDEMLSLKCLGPPRPQQDGTIKTRRVEIAPHFAWLHVEGPGDNLEYPGTPPDDMRLYMVGGTVTYWLPRSGPGAVEGTGTRLADRFQIGIVARASALHFTGTGVSADEGIVRVGPIASFRTGWKGVQLFLSPQAQFWLGSFRRQEFGALPGDRLTEPVRVHVQGGVTF